MTTVNFGMLKATDAGELLVQVSGAATDGTAFAPDSMAKTITNDAQGRVTSVAVTDGVSTWTQTIAYPSGTSTTVSRWVKS
jgi:hypothetical protein